MKNPSGSTFRRTTSPECFRAVATGVGHTIGQSKMTGEVRKALVRANTPNTIDQAIPNEGFAADSGKYVAPPRGKHFYGAHGDDTAAVQPGSLPPPL